MTFKERLQQDHPKYVSTGHLHRPKGCPSHYGYESTEEHNAHCDIRCIACWDREMPEVVPC